MSSLLFHIFQYVVTTFVIVGVSEAAKRSDRVGGLLAALPLSTVLTLIWLEVEQQPTELIRQHALYTLVYVIPTLPMFLAFPSLYKDMSFYQALFCSCGITFICLFAFAVVLYPFGIYILFGPLSL